MIIKRIDDNLLSINTKSGTFPFQLDICLYLADGVLIDSGSSNILKKLRPIMENEKIICAALTHVHEDHTGAAGWIKENLHIPVYIHKNSIDKAAAKSDIPLYRKIVWGNRDGFNADPMPDCIETNKHRFDIIHTPGHHKDHVVIHEKSKGWLFTGDLYVSRRQFVAFKDENISDAINSIRKILELDFDTVLCGHSGIHEDGKEKLKSKLDFFVQIQEQVRLLEKQGLSHEKINKKLFTYTNLWTIVSRGEWSSLNIVKTI